MATDLWLDDLSIGDVFVSGTHLLTETEVVTFAAQFDPQPFHLSDASARSTVFGGLAASGWHTAAVTMRLLVTGQAPQLSGGFIGAGAEVSWPRPTRPGDRLQVTSTVTDIRPSRSKPSQGMLTLRSETRNQNGEVVQILTSKLVVPRRPESVDKP